MSAPNEKNRQKIFIFIVIPFVIIVSAILIYYELYPALTAFTSVFAAATAASFFRRNK